MNNIGTTIKIACASAIGAISSFFGGWDIWLTTLLVLVILDFITGVLKAIMQKSDKSEKGGLDSRAMFNGGIKKLLTFIIVAVAAVIDNVLSPETGAIRAIAVGYYIAVEGLSIVENAGECGLPLPAKLVSVLEQLKDEKSK